MTDLYKTPQSEVVATPEYGSVRIGEMTRLGRLRYWCYTWVAMLSSFVLIVGLEQFGAVMDGGIVFLAGIPCIFTVLFAIRRCNDLSITGWFLLIGIVPFVGLLLSMALSVVLVLMPGKSAENIYGLPPAPNTQLLIATSVILPVTVSVLVLFSDTLMRFFDGLM